MSNIFPQLLLTDMNEDNLEFFINKYLVGHIGDGTIGNCLERLECEIITMGEQYDWKDEKIVLSPTTVILAYERMMWRKHLKYLSNDDPKKKCICAFLHKRMINMLPTWVSSLKKKFLDMKTKRNF